MLKDKVVVVTGGAGLLGKEFVKSIAVNKGIPIIADINLELAKETRDAIAKKLNYERIYYHRLNINDKDSITDFINYFDNKLSKIDALVNNAYPRNKNYGRHFFDVDYKDFNENLGMNLGGYFLTSQLFSKYFLNKCVGNIINISSIYGVVAPRFEIYDGTSMTTPIEYAAIKAALIHMTKYMAKYFKGNNIRVNSISLGGLLDSQPISFVEKYKEKCLNKGMLTPNDITGTLIYLLSDLSEFVNGQNLIVDDGFTL